MDILDKLLIKIRDRRIEKERNKIEENMVVSFNKLFSLLPDTHPLHGTKIDYEDLVNVRDKFGCGCDASTISIINKLSVEGKDGVEYTMTTAYTSYGSCDLMFYIEGVGVKGSNIYIPFYYNESDHVNINNLDLFVKEYDNMRKTGIYLSSDNDYGYTYGKCLIYMDSDAPLYVTDDDLYESSFMLLHAGLRIDISKRISEYIESQFDLTPLNDLMDYVFAGKGVETDMDAYMLFKIEGKNEKYFNKVFYADGYKYTINIRTEPHPCIIIHRDGKVLLRGGDLDNSSNIRSFIEDISRYFGISCTSMLRNKIKIKSQNHKE